MRKSYNTKKKKYILSRSRLDQNDTVRSFAAVVWSGLILSNASENEM